MLTKKRREEMRETITESIASHELMIQHLEESLVPTQIDASVGRLSRMDTMVNQSTSEMALREARKRLERLRNRLQKIDDPSFDKCSNCGGDISYDRLKAAPDRGICLTCMKL